MGTSLARRAVSPLASAHDWLRSQLPEALEIDAFEGQAWVSFVGFRLDVRLRNWPSIPFCSSCVELNFRTYVRYRDEPGICFLTMHADSRFIVSAARWQTPLPYALADLRYRLQNDVGQLQCVPRGTSGPLLDAAFEVNRALGPAQPNSLDAFLLERCVAFAGDRRGRLFRFPVVHEPWQLRQISLRVCRHSYAALDPYAPLCHFSPGVSALLWPMEAIPILTPPRSVERASAAACLRDRTRP